MAPDERRRRLASAWCYLPWM